MQPIGVLSLNAYPVISRAAVAQARCALSHDHDPPAVLAIGTAGRVVARAHSGDLADRYAATLLQRGLALLTSCRRPIPAVAGLDVRIDADRLRATAPGGETLFDGLLRCPAPWLAAGLRHRQVTVIAAAGLDLGDAAGRAGRLDAVTHAIRTGHAVAGVAWLTVARHRTLGERRAA